MVSDSGLVINRTLYDSRGVTSNAISGSYDIFGYTGRELDYYTKLQYNRARWLDLSNGRWNSQDPIGLAAGDMNLYRYVHNNPSNATDPSGNVANLVTAAVGAVVGGIVGGIAAGMNGDNVWAGIGGGALIGGAIGLTFGLAAGALGVGISGTTLAVGGAGALAGGTQGVLDACVRSYRRRVVCERSIGWNFRRNQSGRVARWRRDRCDRLSRKPSIGIRRTGILASVSVGRPCWEPCRQSRKCWPDDTASRHRTECPRRTSSRCP